MSKFFDLAMMVLPGDMERTEKGYGSCTRLPGAVLARIVPTKTWISVIEGISQ